MKATFVLALSTAGVLALSGIAHAQDMQMPPAQDDATQQSAQSGNSAMTGSTSYGGATSGTTASNPARASNGNQTCTPGLSCNIYQGQ